VEEHDSLSFVHLLPFSTLKIQALSLSQLCTKETSCTELHNRLKAQNPSTNPRGKKKIKNLSPKASGKIKSLPSQISNSANYPKLQKSRNTNKPHTKTSKP
jgi:hypothetical protein